MKTNRILLALAISGLAFGVQAQTSPAASPASMTPGVVSASNEDLLAKVGELTERVARMEAQSKNQGLLSLLAQVQELKTELARLRGAQDEISHAQQLADKRQKELFADLDDRQKALKESVASLDARQKKTLELQSNLNEQIQELASQPATAAAEPVKLQTAQTLAVNAPAPFDAEAEAKAYESALNQFKSGNYSGSVDAFSGFLKLYPAGNLASNAQYWLGLSYFAQTDYHRAAAAQLRLLKDFPMSHKAPDAMVSLARAQIQLGEMGSAKSTLTQVVSRYPVSAAADIARKLLAMTN